jgi:7-carboxy-7-deazaguanine synthase
MKINSIFESISGEGGFFPQGSWVTFIRTQQCPLRCEYCDTLYARDKEGGEEKTIEEIISSVKTDKVLITGGEPLFQPVDFAELVMSLLKAGKQIQVETNGSLFPPAELPAWAARQVKWVVDYKCPYSLEDKSMSSINKFMIVWRELQAMIKFVIIPDMENMEFILECMKLMIMYGYKYNFLISPLNGDGQSIPKIVEFLSSTNSQELLNRIIFSVQLHKIVKLP